MQVSDLAYGAMPLTYVNARILSAPQDVLLGRRPDQALAALASARWFCLSGSHNPYANTLTHPCCSVAIAVFSIIGGIISWYFILPRPIH